MLPNKILGILKLHKTTIALVSVILILVFSGFFIFQKFIASKDDTISQELEMAFDPEGPYALLIPRRDGNATILNLKRTSSYSEISYELAYVSKPDAIATKSANLSDGENLGGVDRGVVGTVDTKQKKGEYEQEILFGTCSKNVCKYDTGVENGTLTLHIKKGKKVYKMNTQWYLQKPDIALGILTSGDGHFTYKLNASREELALIGFTMINDLTGVPKLLDKREVFGKAYALNIPIARQLASGEVTMETLESPPSDAKISRYDAASNKWVEYETTISGSKLTSSADGAGIFAILVSKN